MNAESRDAKNRINLPLSEIDKMLERMERLFPEGEYRLTLIARYVGTQPRDADAVLTLDDLRKVREVIDRYVNRDPQFRAGDRLL